MAGRNGPIWIQVEIDPAVRRALREAPETIQKRMHQALEKGMGIMQRSVQREIDEAGLVRSGKMRRNVRIYVNRSASGDWTGRLRVRRFYGRFQNAGMTLVVDKPLRFPTGDIVEITQVGDRQLKRSRYQLLNVRWVTLKPGTTIRLPATRFFDQGVEAEEQRVLDMFQEALAEAIRQEFGR